jgi:uroporphyrinogen decarboxylase
MELRVKGGAMIMNRRERVLAALKHQEPDRVPIDIGGSDSTGITAIAYNHLKSYLGIEGGRTRIFDPYQQIVDVEEEVLQAVKSDVRSVMIHPKSWKPWKLPDGSDCEIPEKWNPQYREDGSQVVLNEQGEIVSIMPSQGLYFEPVIAPLKDCQSIDDFDRHKEDIVSFDLPPYLDQSFGEMSKTAGEIRKRSDYLLSGGNFAAHVFASSQSLRGWDVFLLDLLERPLFAEALMDRLVEAYCERFDRYWSSLGQYLDVVVVSDDLGTQKAPILSPDLYRRRIKPYHKRLYSYIKEKSDAFIFMHSCGSIYRLIPDLIEAGIDILNPVQVNAAGMDTRRLKKEFGDVLVFWGGGCDTQRILPCGTRQEIRDEVKRRIDDLAPGGGFVFTQVHNILPDVSPENVMAMYEAVWEFGG